MGSKAAFGAVSGNVEVTLGNGVIQYDEDEGKDCVSGFNGLTIKTFTKASIAKGASKAYSFSVKLTDVPSLAWMGIEPGDYLMFSISADAGSGGFYDMYVSDAVIRLAERTAPTISGSLLTDRASMPDAADGSPMEYFGGLLQLVSLPRLRFDFALDPVNYRDPGLTASHLLTWVCGSVEHSVSANTGYGVTTVTLDVDAPLYSGTVTWTYTVTDSYGMSATLTGTFQVTPYLPPNISAFNCERWEEVLTGSVPQHVSSSSGENIWLSLRATVTPINGMNAWNAVLTYWSQDMQESSAWTAGSQVGDNGEVLGWNLSGSDGEDIQLNYDEEQLALVTLDASMDWHLRLTITDRLGNTATLVCNDILKDGALLDIEPHGVAVGMRSTASSGDSKKFEVAEDWKKCGLFPVGSIYLSVNSTNPSEYFGGTWVSFGAGRVLVGVNASDTDFDAALKTGGQKTHKLTVSEMPAHAHEPSNVNTAGSDKNYKRNFTTNLHTSSDSVARIKVAATSSTSARSVMAATDADDIAGVQKTTSVGGSTAHNNLQPYIAVFMWRRTA